MTTVAVLGAASTAGQALLARLDSDPSVDALLAIDVDEPQMPVAKLAFRTADLRDPLLAHALDGADIVVHCGLSFDVDQPEDALFARNVHGTANLLEAVAKIGARKLIVCSSTTVYGAHPDNEVPLTEAAALRANPEFAIAHQYLLAEELITAWAGVHPDVTVTVLRPAVLLGTGVDHYLSRMLESPRLLTIRGCVAPLQFVGVEDLASALGLAVTDDLPGAFNVAADGWLALDEVSRILGRRQLQLPEVLGYGAATVLWPRGLSPASPGMLAYFMHPVVVSSEALQAHGWVPQRANRELLHEFSDAHAPFWSLGRVRLRKARVYIGGAGAIGLGGLTTAVAGAWAWRAYRRKRQQHGR